jgi:hypothetical protein
MISDEGPLSEGDRDWGNLGKWDARGQRERVDWSVWCIDKVSAQRQTSVSCPTSIGAVCGQCDEYGDNSIKA